jgi:hypothetical protein
MSKYKGKSVSVNRSAEEIYNKMCDLSGYQEIVDDLPADLKEKLNGVEFTSDSFRMDAPGVGQLLFRLTEKTAPTHVGFTAEGSPIPVKLMVDLQPVSESTSSLTPSIDIELPAMLRPFIGNKLQEAADKFGEVFTSLFK